MNQKQIAARFGREVANRVYFDSISEDPKYDAKTARCMMFAMADALTNRAKNTDLYYEADRAYWAHMDHLKKLYG